MKILIFIKLSVIFFRKYQSEKIIILIPKCLDMADKRQEDINVAAELIMKSIYIVRKFKVI